MQVILTSRISSLGQIGEVVTVKNGYAKNFLIPQKKAIFYNANNYKSFEAKKNEFESHNNDLIKIAEGLKAKIIGKNIAIIENASDDGRLYGSVNNSVIAHKISEASGVALAKNSIVLHNAIKAVGIYDILINIHNDVKIVAKIVVARSESEVSSLIAGNKEVEDVVEQKEKPQKKKGKQEKEDNEELEEKQAL